VARARRLRGHLVADTLQTRTVMIVGGGHAASQRVSVGTRSSQSSNGNSRAGARAGGAFWLTALAWLAYISRSSGKTARIGRLVQHGWDTGIAKAHMGKWYKVKVGRRRGGGPRIMVLRRQVF